MRALQYFNAVMLALVISAGLYLVTFLGLEGHAQLTTNNVVLQPMVGTPCAAYIAAAHNDSPVYVVIGCDPDFGRQ